MTTKWNTYSFELLEYARVQILVHLLVFESIACCFLQRNYRRIEVLQLSRETHANLEGVRHLLGLVVPRDFRAMICFTLGVGTERRRI